MTKITIKILQGSAVVQNALGELQPSCKFPVVCVKNCENRLTCVEVMSEDKVSPFY